MSHRVHPLVLPNLFFRTFVVGDDRVDAVRFIELEPFLRIGRLARIVMHVQSPLPIAARMPLRSS